VTAVLVLCAVLAAAAASIGWLSRDRAAAPSPVVAWSRPAVPPLPSRVPVSGERLTGPLPVLRAGWPEVSSG